jgi:hypothetical protein
VTDGIQDVVVPPAVRRQLVVVVEMRVIARMAGIAAVPQPPAMAGSSRTSSVAPTGVSSPAR